MPRASAANASAPLLASGVDFVLEGLYATKKISRSDERGYHGAEPTIRKPSREMSLDDEPRVPSGGAEEEVLQLETSQGSGLRPQWTSANMHEVQIHQIHRRPARRDRPRDLVSKLSDLLLSSGFSNPWGNPLEDENDRTMQALHDAILEALFSGGCCRTRRFSGCSATGRRRPGTGSAAARRPGAADHRADDGAGLRHRARRISNRSASIVAVPAAASARTPAREVRGDRQGARFPRLPGAARSARLDRPQRCRPPRHAPL